MSNSVEVNNTPSNHETVDEKQQLPKKINGLSIISVLTGIVGLFILSIFLGPFAILTGTSAYSQIKRNPNQLGKQLALIGIFFGVIDTVSLLIAIYIAS